MSETLSFLNNSSRGCFWKFAAKIDEKADDFCSSFYILFAVYQSKLVCLFFACIEAKNKKGKISLVGVLIGMEFAEAFKTGDRKVCEPLNILCFFQFDFLSRRIFRKNTDFVYIFTNRMYHVLIKNLSCSECIWKKRGLAN